MCQLPVTVARSRPESRAASARLLPPRRAGASIMMAPARRWHAPGPARGAVAGGGGSPALGRRSSLLSLAASHGGRLAATGSEAASAGLPVTAASVHTSGQSPGCQWQGAAQAASRTRSSSTTLAAGPDGNHTVTATATGTSSSLASYIAALIGFAIDAHHPESRRPPGRRVPAASLSLASSLFRPSASSSVIRRSHSQWTRRRHFAFKVWHSMSGFKFPVTLVTVVPVHWSFKSRLLHRDSDSRMGHEPSAGASVDDARALAIAQQPQLAKLPAKLTRSARPRAAGTRPACQCVPVIAHWPAGTA